MKDKLCINCKRFGEGNNKYVCFLNGKYNYTIHNPEKESCNFWSPK